MADSTSKLIVQYLVDGLRTALNMNEANLYPVVAEAWIEGMEPLTVQVKPGGETPDGPGSGAWEGGGAQLKRMRVTFHIYKRLNTDEFKRSEQILTEESSGLLDFHKRLWDCLKLTDLGGLTYEILKWEGRTEASWVDKTAGWVQSSVAWSMPYADALGTTQTL